MKHVIVAMLVLALAAPASAGPIAESAARAAAAAAAQGPQGGGPGWNVREYFGAMLVSSGIGVTIAGLVGFRDRYTGPYGHTDTTASTRLTVIGAGMIGSGLALLLVHRNPYSPDVRIGAQGLTVTKTIGF